MADVDVMDSELEALQSECEALSERVAAKRDALATIRAATADVVGELVDATDKARPGLVRRHSELRAEADACAAELAELCRRRDRAYMARYELAEAKAKAAAASATAAMRSARLALNGAIERHHRALNGGQGGRSDAEHRRHLADLEAVVARARAESTIATAESGRTAAALAVAERATAQARGHINA